MDDANTRATTVSSPPTPTVQAPPQAPLIVPPHADSKEKGTEAGSAEIVTTSYPQPEPPPLPNKPAAAKPAETPPSDDANKPGGQTVPIPEPPAAANAPSEPVSVDPPVEMPHTEPVSTEPTPAATEETSKPAPEAPAKTDPADKPGTSVTQDSESVQFIPTKDEPVKSTPEPAAAGDKAAPATEPTGFDINLSAPPPEKPKEPKKQPLISLQMVSKTYGEDPLDYKTLVLKNIYLEIQEGEFVIIYGPSGSGKSTLLHILAGLEGPTAGRVLVREQDVAQFSSEELARYHRLKMGMVFQSFNLIKSLNVWENVALPQTANGINYAVRKKKALSLLKLLNIDHYADRHPNEISGGEQQRVAIARALVNNPYFLLVDEPTGNLDTKSADEVMQLVYDLNYRSNHTIVLVTHNPNHLHFATRVVYIEDGKVIIEEKRDREAFIFPKTMDDTQAQKLGEFRGTL